MHVCVLKNTYQISQIRMYMIIYTEIRKVAYYLKILHLTINIHIKILLLKPKNIHKQIRILCKYNISKKYAHLYK